MANATRQARTRPPPATEVSLDPPSGELITREQHDILRRIGIDCEAGAAEGSAIMICLRTIFQILVAVGWIIKKRLKNEEVGMDICNRGWGIGVNVAEVYSLAVDVKHIGFHDNEIKDPCCIEEEPGLKDLEKMEIFV